MCRQDYIVLTYIALEEASKKRLLTQTTTQQAQMADVESYVDMLYEEVEDKNKGTQFILQVHIPDLP